MKNKKLYYFVFFYIIGGIFTGIGAFMKLELIPLSHYFMIGGFVLFLIGIYFLVTFIIEKKNKKRTEN